MLKIYFKNLLAKMGIFRLSLYLVVLIIFYVLSGLGPYFITQIFEHMVRDEPFTTNFYFYLFLMIVSFMSVSILRYPNNYFLQLVRKYSKEILWQDNQKKSYLEITQTKYGDFQNLISEISSSSRAIQYDSLQSVFKAIVTITVYSSILFTNHVLIGLLYTLSYLIYFILSYYLSSKNQKDIKNVLDSSSEVNSYMLDYYRNIETVISSHSFVHENEILEHLLEGEKTAFMSLQRRIDNGHLCQQLYLMASTVVVLLMTVILGLDVMANVSIFLVIIYSIFNLSGFGSHFLSLMEHKGRISEALKQLNYHGVAQTSMIEPSYEKMSDEVLVSIENLSFKFDQREVIKGLHFEIDKHDKMAILGKNGAGKSTLLKILSGLLAPSSGSLKFNQTYFKHDLDILYFSQKSELFDRSIYENMIYPSQHYPVAAIMKIVEQLNLSELITDAKDLMDKKPGDFGTRFSGGEKQKILIARAIINGGALVIFDEITSSLDVETVKKLGLIINHYLSESAVVFVTHHGAEVSNFKRILDLSQ